MISTPETPCNKLRCRGALVARIRKWNEVPNPTDNDFLYGLWFLRRRLSPDKITKNQGERVGGRVQSRVQERGGRGSKGEDTGGGCWLCAKKTTQGYSEVPFRVTSCTIFVLSFQFKPHRREWPKSPRGHRRAGSIQSRAVNSLQLMGCLDHPPLTWIGRGRGTVGPSDPCIPIMTLSKNSTAAWSLTINVKHLSHVFNPRQDVLVPSSHPPCDSSSHPCVHTRQIPDPPLWIFPQKTPWTAVSKLAVWKR